MELICDDNVNPGSFHYLEISLKLEGFGTKPEIRNLNSPGILIWDLPKEQFAVRCKTYLVNAKEEIIHSGSKTEF